MATLTRSSGRYLPVYMDRPVKPFLITLVKLIPKLRQTICLCEQPAIVLFLLVSIEPVADIAVLSHGAIITLNIKLNCPPRIHRMDILKVSQTRIPPTASSTLHPVLHVKVVLLPIFLEAHNTEGGATLLSPPGSSIGEGEHVGPRVW